MSVSSANAQHPPVIAAVQETLRIARVNEALDRTWPFEITHHEIREDEGLVVGTLTGESVRKMAFGTVQRPGGLGADALFPGGRCAASSGEVATPLAPMCSTRRVESGSHRGSVPSFRMAR
jgi:hypothetical protein